jgi:polyhydroxyalkanoate synthesis regulator phasin
MGLKKYIGGDMMNHPHHHQVQDGYRQQQPAQTQLFPWISGFPIPGGDLNQRVRRLEDQYYRLEAEVDRLNRRIIQLERRVRQLEGGGYYPWSE